MNLLPIHLAAPQTYGDRHNTPIDMLVIHVTESDTLNGTASWFATTAAPGADPHAIPHAAAHYIVGPNGDVCQCVPEGSAAYHAGNLAVNRRSIGIEIVGFTATLKMPTEQFLALAELIRDIRRRHPNISLDRDHLIGHCEVPDPMHLGLFGGAGHHFDPGPHFDWTLFLTQLAADFTV